ncbi:MAG: hypothetical protein AMXMBFR82_33630 [Candidatus Hydrogenedentota bacterium]
MYILIAAVIALAAPPSNVVVFNVDGLTADAGEYATTEIDGIPALSPDMLLILLQSRAFPAVAIPPLQEFLERGGHVVAVDGPPFEELLFRGGNGRWLGLDELLADVKPEHSLVDWAAVNASPPSHSAGSAGGNATYTPLANGYATALTIPEAASWMVREIPVHNPAPAEHDTLRFRLSGSGPAPTLLVEVREKDGTRWMAKAPLAAEPREVGIHQTGFQFWNDGSPANRGFKGDVPNLANLAAMQFGFAASHQQLHAGQYTYRIEGIATGICGTDVIHVSPPKLEGFSPSYKLFSTTAVRTEPVKGFNFGNVTVPSQILSPVARPMHDVEERPYVWEPLVKAFDGDGRWIATPMSTTWYRNGSSCTLIGWEPEPDELAIIVDELAARLAKGKPAFPAPALLADDTAGDTVSVRDGQFTLNGEPWFANGINFWPGYVAGMEPPEYYSHWLSAADYIPELVDQDLATLNRLGVNLVSIQFEQLDQVPQLHDFLARCGHYGIKVNIFLRGAHPLHPDPSDDLSQRPFLELMRAANLRGNPHVFAYDLAWEPRMGVYAERRRYDPLFVDWVEEQYGNVERAQEVWGIPANREDGSVTGPTDDQLRNDGPHRIMVAAYRRFADDLISRRYGAIVRLARQVDDSHLFGVRTGYGGTGTKGVVRVMPFQLTSGAAHLDFVSPEGYGYGPKNISDAAFVTAYARWAGNGKPVFWAEFGYSVLNGGAEALETQAMLYEAFAHMIRISGADGWAGWWYPGGLRVDERSDYGIIAPDGQPRLATAHLAQMAETPPRPSREDVETLVVERDDFVDGLAGAVERHSRAFETAYANGTLPRIRTNGSETTSSTCPFTGVGGIPFEAPGPAQYLNAEIWVETSPEGSLRVFALNTGEAAWDSDDCRLVWESADGGMRALLIGPIRRFEMFEVDLDLRDAGQLYMRSDRFGAFGQRLNVVAARTGKIE